MKSKVIMVMLLALGLGLTFSRALSVSAQEEQVAVQTITVSGNLVAVDTEKSTITIGVSTDELDQAEKVLVVNDATTIEKAGEVIKLADLVVDTKVTVEYSFNDSGEMVAQYIWVD